MIHLILNETNGMRGSFLNRFNFKVLLMKKLLRGKINLGKDRRLGGESNGST